MSPCKRYQCLAFADVRSMGHALVHLISTPEYECSWQCLWLRDNPSTHNAFPSGVAVLFIRRSWSRSTPSSGPFLTSVLDHTSILVKVLVTCLCGPERNRQFVRECTASRWWTRGNAPTLCPLQPNPRSLHNTLLLYVRTALQ